MRIENEIDSSGPSQQNRPYKNERRTAGSNSICLSVTLCGPLKKEEKIRRGERMAPPDSHANYRATCSELLLYMYVLHISLATREKKGLNQPTNVTTPDQHFFLPLCLSLRHEKCHFQEILRPTDRRDWFLFSRFSSGKKANGTFPRFAAGLTSHSAHFVTPFLTFQPSKAFFVSK